MMSAHCSTEMLSSFVDDELASLDRERVRLHVESCTECRRRLSHLRRVVDQLRRLEQVAVPSSLGLRVEGRLKIERRRRSIPTRLGGGLEWVTRQPVFAPLFALIIAFAAILYLFSLGVATNEIAGTRVVVGAPAPPAEREGAEDAGGPADAQAPESGHALVGDSEEAPARGESDAGAVRVEPIVLAGRRFLFDDGAWVEEGLGSTPADVALDVGGGDPLPKGLEDLGDRPGRYRLRYQDEVIEVLVPES